MRRLLAAVLFFVTAPVAHAAEPQTCADVEIIATAGTGAASVYDDPANIVSFGVGTNFVAHVVERFDNVSAWQTPYPASAGVAGTVGPNKDTVVLPYGKSQQIGVERVVGRLSEMAPACPNTKWILVGFSQGADITGDVAQLISSRQAPIGPDRLLAAYLVADPGRARVLDQDGMTDTGTSGTMTADGAVLVRTSASSPAPGTVGLAGARPDGAFSNLPGKVRHICAGDDPACAVTPGGLLAGAAARANADPADGYDGHPATLRSMLIDGSLHRALGPHGAQLLDALTFGRFQEAEQIFAQAAGTPGLSPEQAAAITLFGHELLGTALGVDIPDQSFTGDAAVDRLINVYLTTNRELRYASAMSRNHTAYTGESRDSVVRIDGARADDWLESDIHAVITKELGAAQHVAPVPYAERDTWWQRFGHPQWSAVQFILGSDHPWARALWDFYGL